MELVAAAELRAIAIIRVKPLEADRALDVIEAGDQLHASRDCFSIDKLPVGPKKLSAWMKTKSALTPLINRSCFRVSLQMGNIIAARSL